MTAMQRNGNCQQIARHEKKKATLTSIFCRLLQCVLGMLDAHMPCMKRIIYLNALQGDLLAIDP